MEYEKHNVRKLSYKNGVVFRYNNRRLLVGETENKGCHINLKTVDGSTSPRTLHEVIRGKIVSTTFRLSRETSELLMFGLAETLGYDLRLLKKEDKK